MEKCQIREVDMLISENGDAYGKMGKGPVVGAYTCFPPGPFNKNMWLIKCGK